MSFGQELGILLEETSICISSLDKQDLVWFKVENGKCIHGYYLIIVCARSEIWRGNTLFGLKKGTGLKGLEAYFQPNS